MARYLSPEWVESFDAALGALDLSDALAAAGAASLAAADGSFSVVQVVTGRPGARLGRTEEVRVVLTVADGRAHLGLDPEGAVAGTATIVLGYPERSPWRVASSTRPTHWPPGGCGCGATWRRSSPARTCWPPPRRSSARSWPS